MQCVAQGTWERMFKDLKSKSSFDRFDYAFLHQFIHRSLKLIGAPEYTLTSWSL